MIFRSLFYGIERVSTTKNGIFWYFFPNFVFSFFISLFITLNIEPFLSSSIEGEKFLKDFDPSFFQLIEFSKPDFLSTSKNLLIVFSPLFVLTYIFLSGGAIKLLSREWRSYDFNFFLSGCYNFSFRFFRLFIISLPFYLIPFFLIKFYIIPHFEKIYGVEDVKLIFSKSLIYIFSFFIFSIVNLTFDVTKIRIVEKNSDSVLAELFYTIIYIFKNLLPTLSLYICTMFLNIIPLGLYILISPFFLRSSSSPSIIFYFAIYQLILLIRIWIKFVFWASQRELWLFFESRKIYLKGRPTREVRRALD